MIARFKLELSLSRLLTHPNIIRLFDLGIHRGWRYLTMELLEVTDLYTKLTETGRPVPLAQGLAWSQNIATASLLEEMGGPKKLIAFAQKLAVAENAAGLVHLNNINKAGADPRFWRASAWLLERLHPDLRPSPLD